MALAHPRKKNLQAVVCVICPAIVNMMEIVVMFRMTRIRSGVMAQTGTGKGVLTKLFRDLVEMLRFHTENSPKRSVGHFVILLKNILGKCIIAQSKKNFFL